jgi:toxin HigB-1
MDIEFLSPQLRVTCTSERQAVRELGQPAAKKLFARLADLKAAEHVGELIVGYPHPLKGDRTGQFAVRLEGGKRLVFASADEPVPVHDDGSVDWKRVTRICIVFIGDYHD